MYVGKLTDAFERAFVSSMEFAVVCTSLAKTVGFFGGCFLVIFFCFFILES